MNWIFHSEIEQRAKGIVFHEGGTVDDRVIQRARQEVIDEKIDNVSTKEELRDILRFLAKEAGVI
ncbi:hypothetical protein [Burkholderia cepacia]|uniref:hypothetical protein n=1 Tax=Burkholderia cepacia TaxID=292 RepID=UPI001576F1D0|nr:hypothetical protein [Burkholderia cepacia]